MLNKYEKKQEANLYQSNLFHYEKKVSFSNLDTTKTSATATMDTDGKVVFKVKLGDEIKKIVIHNEDINFNELLLMMQRIFSEKIKPNDEFSMKYTDEGN